MDRVHPWQGGGDDGMPHLVIGHDLALVRIEQSAGFLDAGYDAFDCTSEVVCADGVSAAPRCPQRGFVDQIGQVGARKARRQRRDHIEIDSFGELDLFRMYAKNCCTADQVRPIDQHLAVGASGPQQRRIQNFWPIDRGEQHDAVTRVEAIPRPSSTRSGL